MSTDEIVRAFELLSDAGMAERRIVKTPDGQWQEWWHAATYRPLEGTPNGHEPIEPFLRILLRRFGSKRFTTESIVELLDGGDSDLFDALPDELREEYLAQTTNHHEEQV